MTIETISFICQIMIPFTGLTAVYLIASQEPRTRMWAGIFGLAGEPFWLTSAWLANQWGIMILAFFYAYSYWRVFDINRKAMQL